MYHFVKTLYSYKYTLKIVAVLSLALGFVGVSHAQYTWKSVAIMGGGFARG